METVKGLGLEVRTIKNAIAHKKRNSAILLYIYILVLIFRLRIKRLTIKFVSSI